SAPLAGACQILLADSVVAGALAAGIHRSTAYDRIGQLRREASASGLRVYFGGLPDTSVSSPVWGERHAALERGAAMETRLMPDAITPARIRLLLSEAELRMWLSTAKPGEVVEYHRGFLSLDRVKLGSRLPAGDRAELDRLAKLALTAASS